MKLNFICAISALGITACLFILAHYINLLVDMVVVRNAKDLRNGKI